MTKFIYTNVNPEKLEINDCVCRAISLASGLSYEDVEKKLFFSAQLLECDKLCVCCYSFLLDVYFGFERMNERNISVGEFAKKYNKGIYICRVHQHLTCIIDGAIRDIWDCSKEIITDAWCVDN